VARIGRPPLDDARHRSVMIRVNDDELAALKAAAVRIVSYTAPPSETNYMGVMLTGDQSACKAAAVAFQNKVLEVASNPFSY